jgi:hypothetical protein
MKKCNSCTFLNAVFSSERFKFTLFVDREHQNVFCQTRQQRQGTPEHASVSASRGFSYRTLLGELLYANITCRPTVGHAVVALSKFGSASSSFHFKNVAKYLRRTKHWGIRSIRQTCDSSLRPGEPLVFGLILTSPLSRLHDIHCSSLDLLMPHVPMICATANLLLSIRSF